MPLDTDWETDSANTNGTVDIQHTTANPINGNRSVRITCTTGAASFATGAIMLDDAVHSRGFVLGKIRTLMRVDTPGDTPENAGIYCLGSVDVGIANAGDAYTFGPVGATQTLQLSKLNGGLQDATPALLFDTGVAIVPGTFKAIELQWKAELTIFGGVQFTMLAGNAIDFSDLATIGTHTDETLPLVASNSEGLFLTKLDDVESCTVVYDDTTVIQTTII